MNMQSLRKLATKSGVINPESIMSEQTLVRTIQRSQGHAPCFQTDDRYFCKEQGCPWTPECKKLLAVWMR